MDIHKPKPGSGLRKFLSKYGTGAALTAFLLAAGPTWASTACDQLAARAKSLPAAAWTPGSSVLKPWLKINEEREARGALETRLTRDPDVRAAIGGEDGRWNTYVDRLAGADLYAVWTVQGTLHCQNIAFVRAGPRGEARIVREPPDKSEKEGELCWTRHGNFGTAFGHPIYIEHGANDQRTDDEDIRITPWAGEGWGQACTLKLRYRTKFKVGDRKCHDTTVCAAVDSKVLAITAAYDRRLRGGDETPFRYGTGEVPAAVKAAAEAERPSTDVPNWPGFGKEPDGRSVSYEGLAYFPLMLDGHAYVGALSHEGVGWRGSNTALLLVYALRKGELQPQAAYAVDRFVSGLREVNASH